MGRLEILSGLSVRELYYVGYRIHRKMGREPRGAGLALDINEKTLFCFYEKGNARAEEYALNAIGNV